MPERNALNSCPDLNLPDVAANFSMKGTFANARPFGSGHIHDTFLVQTRERNCPDYILQRLNHAIFQDVPRLMENIVRVTNHIRGKLSAIPGARPEREVLTVMLARDGRPYHLDEAGNYWRCFMFIEHHELGERSGELKQAFEAGRLYGLFINLLSNLPGPPLHEIIPRFHDVEFRLGEFEKALQADPCSRAGKVAAEIAFVKERAETMKLILHLGQAGRIPLRITHNDTKFNNILFDEHGRGLCIIDLDTVMPGYVHYDFGDAIRSGANRVREDERDLERVGLDIALFAGYTKGFLASLHGCLTEEETSHLAFSAKLFAFLIGLRFLSDHLAGDRYFKIKYPGHNLQRARVQFRLLEDMERQFSEMEDIVLRTAEKNSPC
jgi:hypothetical protein